MSIDCLNQRQLDEALEAGTASRLAELARSSIVFTRAWLSVISTL